MFLSTQLGLTHLAAMGAEVQPQATYLLQFGRADDTAAYIALAVFILCMLASFAPRKWVAAGTAFLPLTPTGSRRRR